MSDQNTTDLTVLNVEQVTAVETMTRPIVEQAKAIEVVDEATFALAMDGKARCDRGVANVEDVFGETKKNAHATWQSITRAIKGLCDPLREAAALFERKAYAWRESERKRLAAEEKKRQDAARKREEDARLAIATDLSAVGLTKEADALIEAPVAVAPQAVEAPKAAGYTFVENWQWECVELKDLVEAVAAGKAPLAFLTTADSAITKVVKALKASTTIPGVRVYDKGTTRRTGAA